MTTGLGANQLYAIKMLEEKGSLTTFQIANLLGIKETNRAMKLMGSLRDRRMVYVSARGSRNEATWSLGDKPDVPKKAMPGNKKTENYRNRTKKRIGSGLMAIIRNAQNKKTVSTIVIDGVKIWERGRGILV